MEVEIDIFIIKNLWIVVGEEMKKYKAKISTKHFDAFVKASEKEGFGRELEKDIVNQLYGNWGGLNSTLHDLQEEMFNLGFMHHNGRGQIYTDILNKLKILIPYVESHSDSWNVEVLFDDNPHMLISFSGNKFYWHKDYCELEEMKDYDNVTAAELRLLGGERVISNLPAELNAVTISSLNEANTSLEGQLDELRKQRDGIGDTPELKELQTQIDKLKDELREKKEKLEAQIREKMEAINEQIENLNKQVYMMESQIYTIRSYTGETVELNLVREGTPANKEAPLIINQKLMYLDEDMARIVSIYSKEIAREYGLFEDALKHCDELFDSFCPQDRCLTFFRLSKNASYRWYDVEHNMYQTEELLHGKKMGFILRDGERAYLGWLDESWGTEVVNKKGRSEIEERPVTFQENLIYRPGETSIRDMDDAGSVKSDSRNTMLSRVFAMSVVQGILDNMSLLEFPEKVNVTKPSRYLTYNFAEGWIMDDRFGDFATLVENLNKRTKVKDTVLITYNKYHCQGRGDNDRAHDCEVPEGLNKVNLIEMDEYGDGSIYVSAKKKYSYRGATANVLLKRNEYINITYMNSVWLAYYVQTKKLGKYCEDYAKMVKHLKKAIEVIKQREEEEMAAIKQYYPEADMVPEWEIKLSHWKMKNNIRFITDFQAKRVAAYFEKGEFYEIKNLFEKENYENEVVSIINEYATNFSYNYFTEKDAPRFSKKSEYGKHNFYLHTNYRGEIDEDNQKRLDAELIPKVPARIPLEEEKLEEIRTKIVEFARERGILDEAKAIIEHDYILAAENFSFIPLEELTETQEKVFYQRYLSGYDKYIKETDLWKIAYYDHLQSTYNKIIYEMRMILHSHFMNDIVCDYVG